MTWLHRAARVDGTERSTWPAGLDVGANPADPGATGDGLVSGVRLSTGQYESLAVDINLPCAGPSWVIGRTRTTEVADGGKILGPGWTELSQSQLKFLDRSGDADDVVFIFAGGDRYLEFRRVMNESTSTEVFRGVNGTAGAVTRSGLTVGGMSFRSLAVGGGGNLNSMERFIYHDPSGRTAEYFGFDGTQITNTSGTFDARGQIWRITDASGYVAYVGHPTSATTAITQGYDSLGRIKLAYDSAGRRYDYTHASNSSTGGVPRLTSVVATFDSVEVMRAEYSYYEQLSERGRAGDLKEVKVTTPASASGIDPLITRTHHRYWTTQSSTTLDDLSRGPAGSLRLVLFPEGVRNVTNGGQSVDSTTLTDTTLEPYGATRLGYDTDAATGRVNRVVGGALTNVRHDLTHSIPSSPPSTTNDYDQAWASRVKVTTTERDSSPQTLREVTWYFDEVGQPLSRVVDVPGAGGVLVSAVERNTDGLVTREGTPESISACNASTGALTFNNTAGRVNIYDRTAGSGDPTELTGFVRGIGRSAGWSSSAVMQSTMTYQAMGTNFPRKNLGSYTVRRPLIATTTSYRVGGGSGDTTTITYYLPTVADTTSQALTIDWLKVTRPAVAWTENGSGSARYSAVAMLPNGLPTFIRGIGDANGTMTAMNHALPASGVLGSGLITSTCSDWSTSTSGFGAPPSGFPSPSYNPAPHIWNFTYDSIGRETESSGPDGLTTKTVYGTRPDGRMMWTSGTRRTSESAFLSPAQFGVVNLAGRTELSAQIGSDASPEWNVAATLGGAPESWLSWTSTDSMHVVAGTGNQLRSPVLACYDNKTTASGVGAGLRVTHVWQYHTVPGSGVGSADTATTTGHYEVSRLTYDLLGQVRRRINPAGAFTETVRDSIGRPTQVIRGSDTDGTGSSTAYQGVVADMEYTIATGRLAKLTMYPGSAAYPSDSRVTDYFYDALGRLTAVASPAAPHPVYAYDNLDRAVSVAKSNYTRTNFLSANPGTLTPDTTPGTFWRDDTWFDAVGQIHRESNARSYGASSPVLKALVTERWFDAQGRITREHGSSTRKWEYADRCGGGEDIEYTIAMSAMPGQYSDAYLLSSADYILHQRHTIYDAARVFSIGQLEASRKPLVPGSSQAGGGDELSAGATSGVVTLASGSGSRVTAIGWTRDAMNRISRVIDFGNGWNEQTTSSGGAYPSVDLVSDTADFIPGSPFTKFKAQFTWFDALGRVIETRNQIGGFSSQRYDEIGRVNREYSGMASGGSSLIEDFPPAPSCDVQDEKQYERRQGLPEMICLGNTACDPNEDQSPAHFTYPPAGNPASICTDAGDCDPARYFSPDEPYKVTIPPSALPGGGLLGDRDAFTYTRNWLGEVVSLTDSMGVRRTFDRDGLGRVVFESFTYPTTTPKGLDTSIASMEYSYSACNRCIATKTNFTSGPQQVSTISRDSWQNEWAVEQKPVIRQGGTWVNPLPPVTGEHPRTSRTSWGFEEGAVTTGAWRGPRVATHQLPHSPDAGGSVQADEEYLIGQDFGPRGLSAIPLDLDSVVGRLSAKRGNGLPGCAGTGTCTDEILEKTGYHGIYPIPGHGGAEVLQQPRGGEQQRPYGPEGPVGMIWPKGGQTDTGLDPWGRTRSTRSTEYCAGVNTCCTSPPCDDEEPYRTHLRDDDAGSRPQDQCACVYHEDQQHPTEYRKPEIFCAGVSTSDLGVGYVGSSLVPQDARRENWTYDTRRNWTGHEVKSYQSAATPQWDLRQRGDYTRSMEYSASDQPTQESITRWTASGTVSNTFAIFHDRRGNLLDDGRQVFEYDALNRLTGVWESAGGGQSESEYEPGTKGHPVASFTYDGYGHRLTARYNVNANAIIDDDPVDVYAYDRLWRVRTVTRATPSNSTAEATWTWQVREKWYYHDTESGQEMMTGPASTDAPIMRLIDRNGDEDFDDAGEEQHFVNDHQGSTVLVTGKATLDATTDDLVARAPIIAHIKYDQYGTPKFVHPADVNSDGVVDASDVTFWKQTWNEYKAGNTSSTPPSAIWKGVADADENGTVDETTDGSDPTLPSATNTDWLAFQATYTAATAPGAIPLDQQLGNLPLYAGYWWDDAIGLYHVRHRVYRPEWGRWLQRDPLGYAPGWNLYQYVNGTPWASVDPMGLWSIGGFVDWITDWVHNSADGIGLIAEDGATWTVGDAIEGTKEAWDRVTGDPYAEHSRSQMRAANQASKLFNHALRAGDYKLAQSALQSMSLDMYNAHISDEVMTDMGMTAAEMATSAVPTGWFTGRVASVIGKTAAGKAVNAFGNKVFRIGQYMTDVVKTHASDILKRYTGRSSRPLPLPEPEGIIYERLDPRTGERYVGQSESPDRYRERRVEHDRDLKTKHEFNILERAQPGFPLDMAEEDWIRRMGGPKRKGGKLANKRYQVNDYDYCSNGGSVPKPTK